ncbi:tripartite tricarboxylate transporter substrate binding protein [Siccirubricoccus sp. KC 17139]|uniref:Tripartite tricarboxylate transporter substrate binding protein n=1 Tax=Siccirubricoccus soli TaxID=2899147 RepID=A0ABT1D700_9PROT|nr:tripartite tricarboxylate transporter substrate binding protein [Siccirubricoccus soli]MCO6417710.1 tripartite tricarboxylate transporter substrate binding protein [Siccirubricoccus soli]MCP2683845.1 tripartite tricarboxylate transporter substrate binding protein [Siccirubricoccus soli]
MRRRPLLLSTAAMLAAPALIASTGRAQGAYPNRPVRLVIPWPPGQATDLMARVVAQKVSEQWGQPMVPENKAGAGGMIGTDFVAKAPADGYTVLAASTGPITTAPLVQRTAYDPQKDFIPVAMIGISPYVLVVNNNFPAQSAEEFVAKVRAAPGKYTYATSGAGAAAHLITLMFLSRAKLDTVHVPFQGSGPALTAVMAGQVDFAIDTLAATGPLFRQGSLRALGVSLESGTALAPNLKPLAQVPGMAGYDAGAFGGYMMPAGTPAPVVERLAAETAKALATPEAQQSVAGIGMQPLPRGPAEFAAYLRTHSEEFRKVIEANNIRLD